MNKPVNNRAWFLVLPVLILVAFSAVIPLMTVVNYSVQDSFGSNEFFWNGIYWFDDLLHSERMWDALGRQILFSAIVLLIQVPLGIFIALHMPKKGFWASLCLVPDGAAAPDPLQRGGHDLADLRRVDIGLLGRTARRWASTTTTPAT
jgi:glycerol transport system permease protein